MHTEMRSTRETDDRFPPENDKPRHVKCTANLETDGIILKSAYRELDNCGNFHTNVFLVTWSSTLVLLVLCLFPIGIRNLDRALLFLFSSVSVEIAL
jgi:hypothetical protein